MQSSIPEAARVAMEVAARDRLDRLETLTQEQMTAALSYLACCDDTTFDTIVDKVTLEDGVDDPDGWEKAAPYCMLCGADLGVFAERGPDWQHYRGDPDSAGPFEIFAADHEPFIAWRTNGGDTSAA